MDLNNETTKPIENNNFRAMKEKVATAVLLVLTVSTLVACGKEQNVNCDDIEPKDFEKEALRLSKEEGKTPEEAYELITGCSRQEAIDSGLFNNTQLVENSSTQAEVTTIPEPSATATSDSGVDTNPYDNPEYEERMLEYYSQWCTPDGGWHYTGDLESPDYPLPSRLHSPQNPRGDILEIAPGIWEGVFDDPMFGEAVMRMTKLEDGSIKQEIIYKAVNFCSADK